ETRRRLQAERDKEALTNDQPNRFTARRHHGARRAVPGRLKPPDPHSQCAPVGVAEMAPQRRGRGLMTAAELATQLDAKRVGDTWMARCPAHDDHTPSL